MVEDIIIIGSGPAGLTAALYTAREDFKPLVISGMAAGGQLLLTNEVENYPGFPEGVLGPELMDMMRKQASRFGARFVDGDATAVDFKNKPYRVSVGSQTFEANCVIVATGASAKWLGIESEKKFIGRGVSSCATCMPPHSLVVSNPSIHEIETIKVGQKVLTNDGTFRVIEDVTSKRYSGNLITIKARFFRSELIQLTPNHPVLIVKLRRGVGVNYHKFEWSKPMWRDAGKLIEGDILLYPIPRQEHGKTIDISSELGLEKSMYGEVMLKTETHTSHRLPNLINVDEDFALLAGYYLADGYAHSRGVSFAFNYKEQEYANDCARIIKNLFGLESEMHREKSVLKVTAYSKILSMLFEKLFGKYSHEKILPDYFVLLNSSLQKELIKGFWRGDGSIRTKDFVLTSSSRVLIEQLKIILLRLNILPTVEKRKFKTLEHSVIEGRNVRFKHDVYQIIVGGPSIKEMCEVLNVTHPIAAKRKHFNAHGWIRGDFAYLPIKSISKEPYTGPVYNLAVKDNNTYVTTSGIVHNCDAPFFKDKNVIVVGGGDTAMEDSIFLTKFASSVTIVHRRDQLRASNIMQERAKSNPKIKFIWNSLIEEVKGDTKVSGVKLRNIVTNETTEMPIDGVFVAIGYSPNTTIFKGQLPLDARGYITAKDEVETGIEGVYVAGDVSDFKYRQAVTAAGSGAKAALLAREYILKMKYEQTNAQHHG